MKGYKSPQRGKIWNPVPEGGELPLMVRAGESKERTVTLRAS